MILKAQNLALSMLPTIELTVPQLYTTELKSPPEINELITTAYDTSVDLLLH